MSAKNDIAQIGDLNQNLSCLSIVKNSSPEIKTSQGYYGECNMKPLRVNSEVVLAGVAAGVPLKFIE